MELTDLQHKEILKLPDNFKSRVAHFKNEAKVCFKEMAALRSKVFCYGCWAYGGSFFTTGSSSTAIHTFRVSPDSCNTIVAKCGNTWNLIYDISLITKLLIHISTKKSNPNKEKAANKSKFFNLGIDASSPSGPCLVTVKSLTSRLFVVLTSVGQASMLLSK